MLNDLIALMMAIPMALAAKWAVWFGVGLALSIWGRQEQMSAPAAYEQDEAHARPKSGVRSPRHANVATASAAPSSGDPFADLEALFEPQEGTHRMPGEAPAALPAKAEAAVLSPVLAESPRLAAPQSLP